MKSSIQLRFFKQFQMLLLTIGLCLVSTLGFSQTATQKITCHGIEYWLDLNSGDVFTEGASGRITYNIESIECISGVLTALGKDDRQYAYLGGTKWQIYYGDVVVCGGKKYVSSSSSSVYDVSDGTAGVRISTGAKVKYNLVCEDDLLFLKNASSNRYGWVYIPGSEEWNTALNPKPEIISCGKGEYFQSRYTLMDITNRGNSINTNAKNYKDFACSDGVISATNSSGSLRYYNGINWVRNRPSSVLVDSGGNDEDEDDNPSAGNDDSSADDDEDSASGNDDSSSDKDDKEDASNENDDSSVDEDDKDESSYGNDDSSSDKDDKDDASNGNNGNSSGNDDSSADEDGKDDASNGNDGNSGNEDSSDDEDESSKDDEEEVTLPEGTAEGDLIYEIGGKTERIPIGKEGEVLRIVDGKPKWVAAETIYEENTATSVSSPAPGSLLVHNGTECDRLKNGYEGNVLAMVEGSPKWIAPKDLN